jgi:hypothetical protein
MGESNLSEVSASMRRGRIKAGRVSTYDRCVPFAIVLCLAAILAVFALALDAGGEPSVAPPLRPDAIERIADRVERERGLRFTREPDPIAVTPEQAREEGVEALDQDYPAARRAADAELLVLLGLLPPGTDLGEAAASTYGEGVAGYYDPRSGRLRIVKGAQTANRVLYEMTVAHELTHALEDQRFDLDLERLLAGDDAALAYTALIEGTATALMYRYVEQRFGPEETLGGLAASAFAPTGDVPPFLMAQLVFPYTAGEAFVGRLLELGSGDWTVVNAALRFRPPASTEQVMHPQAYVEVDQPERVSLRGPVRALGRGWRELRGGTLGEWLTGRLLARAGGTSAGDAAAGWGGDRYALLGRGDDRAVLARWTWDTPADEDQFVEALRAWGDGGLPDSTPAGADAWRTPDGAGVLRRADGAVTLALAPDLALARAAARAH